MKDGKIDFDFFTSDHVNRSFLGNYLGLEIQVRGRCSDTGLNCLVMQNCVFYDQLTDNNIDLGHMEWENCLFDINKEMVNTYITVIGKVKDYKNKDNRYSCEKKYSITDCKLVRSS